MQRFESNGKTNSQNESDSKLIYGFVAKQTSNEQLISIHQKQVTSIISLLLKIIIITSTTFGKLAIQ